MAGRSNFRGDVPLPDPPPGGKRKCSKCNQYKRCDNTPDSEFSTVINKRKGGEVRYWRSRCKRCEADRQAARARPTGKLDPVTVIENAARRRALTRLTHAAPKLFLMIFSEELERVYTEHGFRKHEVVYLIEKKTQYLHAYIRKIGD